MRRLLLIDAERARRIAWFALWIYIAGLGISAFLRAQGDFLVYYRTGVRVMHGAVLYPPNDSDHFLYAPIFAIAFVPFALFPRHVAQGLFFLINAWALIAFIQGAKVMLYGRSRRLTGVLLAVPVILSFRFIDNNIEHGQINLPVLALCVWSVVLARERSAVWSGVMLATAILIKPFAALAGIYLMLRRKWAALAWSIAGGAVLMALPMVVFGYDGLVEQTTGYLKTVASMTGHYRIMLTNQSAVSAVARIMARFGSPLAEGSAPLWGGMALEALMVAGCCAWFLRGAVSGSDEASADRYPLAALFALMAGFSPIAWKSYYAAMLVPNMLLTAELIEDRRPSGLVWGLWIISVLLNFAPGGRLNRIAMFYSVHFISSLMIIAAIATLWATRESEHVASSQISAQA